MSRDEFAEALAAAMARLGIDQKDAAERSGESVPRINDFLKARRPSSEAKQVAILASLERETRRAEDVIAQAEADVLRRMRQMATDLATIYGATTRQTPPIAELERLTQTPVPPETAPRVRRRAAQ